MHRASAVHFSILLRRLTTSLACRPVHDPRAVLGVASSKLGRGFKTRPHSGMPKRGRPASGPSPPASPATPGKPTATRTPKPKPSSVVETATPRSLGVQSARIVPGDTSRLSFGASVEDVHDALAGLAKRDPVLGEVIHKAGVLPRIAQCQVARGAVHEPNRAFRALARAIVFQQLNGAAAATIFGRVATLVGAESDPTRLSPEAVLSADPGLMRACGLSQRKLEYLNGLAEAFTEKPGIGGLGDAFLERRGLRDDELRNALISLRGVGPWTVDMFCVFYLNRADVLPVGDFGVRKGMMRVYGLSAMPSPEEMEKISESWRPTRTLASFYMWHAADEAEAEVRLERATARGKKSKKEVVTG